MKKILTLTILFAALLVAAISCGKDDPKPAPGKDDPKNPPTDQKVEIAGVTLDKETLTLEVGAEGTLTATIEPATATNKTITWESSDKNIATVENGKVTAVATGEATITAKAGTKTATCKVIVSAKVIEITGVTIDKTTLALEIGAEGNLTATIAPADATDKTITWSSDDEAIATVENGKITAITLGKATITATTANGKKAECVVTVTSPAGTEKTIEDITTIYIPAGTFLMGSPANEPNRYTNERQHSVTFTKGYYMGKYEITNAQYCEFLNAKKADFEISYESEYYCYKIYMTINSSKVEIAETDNQQEGVLYDATKEEFFVKEGYENHPMKYVSWYGATEYATWVGGALPTEAQWEYACRGGQTESLPFGIGDGTKLIKGMANFDSRYPYDLARDGEYINAAGSYGDKVAVGSYESNGWGLYDMHGNVSEWCSDWYSDNYSDNQTDPIGAESGEYRVCRGGDHYDEAQDCRSALRDTEYPGYCSFYIGFRVVFSE